PNGPPNPRNVPLPRDFFIQRFGIEPGTIIVLHAGLIDPVVRSHELAAAAASWPDNFVLIFHERYKANHLDPYVRAVQAAGGTRVLLSLEPVPFEMIDLVYSGAQIGLVCYEPSDANLATTLM